MVGTATEEPEGNWSAIDDIHRMVYTLAMQIDDLADHEPLIWYIWDLWGRKDTDVDMDEDTQTKIMMFLQLTTEMDDIAQKVYGPRYWLQTPNEE